MFRIEKESFTYGDREVTLETGEFARQATAAVMASMGDTAVLCTVVAAKEALADKIFPTHRRLHGENSRCRKFQGVSLKEKVDLVKKKL